MSFAVPPTQSVSSQDNSIDKSSELSVTVNFFLSVAIMPLYIAVTEISASRTLCRLLCHARQPSLSTGRPSCRLCLSLQSPDLLPTCPARRRCIEPAGLTNPISSTAKSISAPTNAYLRAEAISDTYNSLTPRFSHRFENHWHSPGALKYTSFSFFH